MRKKFFFVMNYILVIIFLSAFFKISYASTTGIVYLSSTENKIEKEEEIEISLFIENAKTAAFTSYLYFDDTKLEYVSGPENTNVVENRIIWVWYDETGGNSPKWGELAKFKFKAKEEGVATFTVNGEFYSEVGQLIDTDFKEMQVQVGNNSTKLVAEKKETGSNTESSNATLQSLRLDIEGMTPNFEKKVKDYYVTVSNSISHIDVLAVSENPNAVIEIMGNTNLKEGLNSINIHVTSEDGTQNNDYSIQVTKTDNVEAANTNLEVLAIENELLNPPFDAGITNYQVEISNEATDLNVFAVPEDEKATVQIEGKDNLKEGSNFLKITVTAQNGFSKKIYEVNVYKRNSEEEMKYKEEVEQNQEKLEQIYETQKLSSRSRRKYGKYRE